MKKFSDLSREVDKDLERKIQELYDTYGEIDEALIKRLNLQALIRRAKKTGIRMKRMMKNPAFKQKIARSKKRMKSTFAFAAIPISLYLVQRFLRLQRDYYLK